MIRKLLWLSMVMIACSGMLSAQNFEGVITYEIDIKMPEMKDEEQIIYDLMLVSLGTKQELHCKSDGRYVMRIFIGEALIQEMMVLPDDDKMIVYNAQRNLNKVGKLVGSEKATIDAQRSEPIDSDVEILDRECKMFSITNDDIQLRFYFSPDLTFNLVGFDSDSPMSEVLSLGRVVPLKIFYEVISGEFKFAMKMVAVKIEEVEVPEEIFKIRDTSFRSGKD